ncbi:transcriptional regulator ATRX-like isoform X2 [Culex pipiens pallens]|uniref:transcriptional regulator ATRX-like isoform X2 n=1 Tax=Culex pipiens pallens TaxID=42434 RepID=UPI001954BE6E|nr:transcriptional regulator ATRX-like isoform X2 [Culex pipiens pallens]
MAYSDTDESSVGISSRSGSWQIDSGSSDYEGGVAPAAPKVPTVVGGRRRNPRRRAAKEAGSFRAPSELRSDDSLKVGKKKKKKGVAPAPKVVLPAGERKRNTRKKPQVAAIARSSEVSGEEEEGEDSVAQMRAMLRLPTVLIQVRKYGMDIVDICDQMENLLLDEGNNDEMSRLKQKLNKLSEKCYQKVRAEFDCENFKEPKPRLSRRDKHKPKPVIESDDDSPMRPRRLARSDSVDYTSPDKTGDSTEQQPDNSHQRDESAKDSGNPSSGQDESPSKNDTDVEPEAPSVDEPEDMEPIRDCPPENSYETSIMDITDGDPDCNLFFDTELMAEVCPPPTDSMINETPSINDDIFHGLQNDHDAYTTPIHREIVPPAEPARPASPKKRVTQECNTTDTPTTSIGSRSSVDSHRRRVLPATETPVVQQSLERYFTKKPVEPVEQPPVDDEVLFVSATAGRRQKAGDVQIKSEPEPKPDVFVTPEYVPKPVTVVTNQNQPEYVAAPTGQYQPEPVVPEYVPEPVAAATSRAQYRPKSVAIPTPEYEPEPGPSKAPAKQWMVQKLEAKGPKFITNSDPNPNREPTVEELQYIVPHQPKFSVPPAPTGENPDLELMKNEIDCRTRIPDLSWIAQKAIREEGQRAKRVERNNEKLQQQLQHYQTTMPENQLILDYDTDSKTFIRVHPELVKTMKPHQREGVKFMYDCCYGGVSDVKNSNGSGCILAHCMGLGKTLQVIALMNTVVCYPKMKTKRIIVICPKSTVMNWAQEIQHWLGDIQSGVKLKVFYLPDSSNIIKKLEVLRGFHSISGRMASVLLIGYEAFRSLVFYDASNRKGEKHSEGVRTEVRRVLINPGADLVILDEGHIIKNRKSQTNLSVAEIATKRRIILTGTPIQNNLNEYYCMVNFVKPAYLGSEKEFNEHYATPIKQGQHADSAVADVKYMKYRSYVLHKNLVNFVQRKEFDVLRGFLPEKYEYVLYVPLTPVQEDLYEQYLKRNPLRQETGGAHLLEDYTFMRKIWTHPIVLERAWETAMKKKYGVQERRRATRRAHGFDSSSDDDDDDDKDRTRAITNIWWKQIISADDLESLFPSNKMILLFEILRLCQERGEKCLIFSGYVMVLNMVEHFMKMIDEQGTNPKAALYGFNKFRGPWRPGMDFYRIDGGTSKSTRHEMITKFNDPKNLVTRVFLISTKAGGQGINLVGANRVIILDTSWNPAVDQQGIFRIYRLGQQKPCYIYRLLAMHSMEEKVYSRAVTKQAMSHRVADKKQVDRNYSMADLEELYHFERVDMAARPNAAPAEDELLSNLLWNKHKLIFRYHTHETMLDNKTEQDLTEAEKKVAWAQFKSKHHTTDGVAGLGLDILGGGLGPTDSQLSDPDLDSQVLTELDLACTPNYDDDVKPEQQAPLPPLALPVRQMAPPTPNNKATIFGDDPYNTSYGGGLSIIEEQRQRLSLKPELGVKRAASQVTVSAAEVELLRELEENAVQKKVKGEDDHYEPPAKKKVAARDVPVMDTIDLLNLSYEGDSEEPLEESREEQSTEMEVSIPPSVPVLKSDSGLSMIEYDPVGSTQELASYAETTTTTMNSTVDQIVPPPPVSYEKFKASLVEDPSVTTSTTTASPAAVVVVATCSSPAAVPAPRVIMTRSMKRAAVPLKAGDVPAIKAAKKIK